jgi:hypothetical protein
MDINTDIVLDKAPPEAAKTTEPVVEAPAARPNIRHFFPYGRVGRDDVAAFAAAKVLLESAIAAERETHSRTSSLKVGPTRQHYIIRLMTGGAGPTSSVEADLHPGPLLGTMSVHQVTPDKYAESIDMEHFRTSVWVAVRPPRKGSVDRPVPASLPGRTRGTFDFTVVNGNITHCVWVASPEREYVSE